MLGVMWQKKNQPHPTMRRFSRGVWCSLFFRCLSISFRKENLGTVPLLLILRIMCSSSFPFFFILLVFLVAGWQSSLRITEQTRQSIPTHTLCRDGMREKNPLALAEEEKSGPKCYAPHQQNTKAVPNFVFYPENWVERTTVSP